jgi:hypothetical protein
MYMDTNVSEEYAGSFFMTEVCWVSNRFGYIGRVKEDDHSHLRGGGKRE